MTEDHASRNSGVSRSQPPYPNSNNDLITSLYQIAEAIKETKKSDSIAKLSLVISIITLLSTIILGTLGSVFLFSKQAETNINFSLSHLLFDSIPGSTCSSKIRMGCLATFEVTNQGPDTANGITIDVFITNVTDEWRSSITDVNKFKIETLPSVLKVNKNPVYDEDPSALMAVSKNNAYELTVDSLPPKKSIQIDIGLSPSVPVIPETIKLNSTIYIVSRNLQDYNYSNQFPVSSVLQKYFNNVFSIADFVAKATCKNCNIDPEPLMISTSSLENDSLENFLNPQNQLDSIWAGSLSVTYDRLKGSGNPAISNPLYLWTELDTPTAPLDSSNQTYVGMVTTCVPAGQTGGNQNTCTPSSGSGI